jgi:hypothetical protein
LFALACIAWIVVRFVRTGVLAKLWQSPHFEQLASSVVIAIPIYTLGLCCAGLGWWSLQAAFLPARPPLRPLFATYATTQFAKYLPGNFGHYLGRHLLLRRLGMEHRALLLATLGEAGFLVLASLIWAASAMKVLLPRLPFALAAWQVLLLEAGALGLGYACVQWGRNRNPVIREWIPLHSPGWLLVALPLQMLLFGAMALALMSPAHILLREESGALWLVPAAAAASWVSGFLIVGAPAGLGVREMVFLALLHGHMEESDILLLTAAFRIITFGGDVLFLALGALLGRGMSVDREDGELIRPSPRQDK